MYYLQLYQAPLCYQLKQKDSPITTAKTGVICQSTR